MVCGGSVSLSSGAHNPVTVARPDQARINMMPCDKHERGRVFPQDRFRPVGRHEDLDQPGDGNIPPAVGAGRRDA